MAVAKWLFFIALGLNVFAYCVELRSGGVDDTNIVLILQCAILLFCLSIAAFTGYFQRKYKTEAKEELYQITNCALWWSGAGMLYFFMGFLFTIAGFIFLIFALFLWLEVIHLSYSLRRSA